MTSTKARTTALITPIEQGAQDEAKALAGEGRTAKAIRRLREHSGLGLGTAPVALDLLTQGHTVPTTYSQALDALRQLDAPRCRSRHPGRHFRAGTGTTPLQWLLTQRVRRAPGVAGKHRRHGRRHRRGHRHGHRHDAAPALQPHGRRASGHLPPDLPVDARTHGVTLASQ